MSRATCLEGFLPVGKPAGPSSHDVVAFARRRLDVRRVGHTGTLDPFALGLLLLCLNRATRLVEYLHPLPKEYVATAFLGVATSTDDPEGEPTTVSNAWREVTRSQLASALNGFLGTFDQRPPDHSAKKVRGEPAYARARRGEDPGLRPVPVTVHRIELLRVDLPRVRFRVECSTGTYVRSLARDLGRRLGTGAHLTRLERTAIGPVRLDDAIRPSELDDPESVRRALISPLDALAHLPRVDVGPEDAVRLEQGRRVPIPSGAAGDGEGDCAVAARGRLLAVARLEAGGLHPKKVFPRA